MRREAAITQWNSLGQHGTGQGWAQQGQLRIRYGRKGEQPIEAATQEDDQQAARVFAPPLPSPGTSQRQAAAGQRCLQEIASIDWHINAS
ncbi:hypothetical protein D3C86_1773480 [compost metagenome]